MKQPMTSARFILALVMSLLGAALLSACASRPLASVEQDEQAKAFRPHAEAATIYVYRSRLNDVDHNTILYMNGRLIGRTMPGGFFRIDTLPGLHVLHGTGIDLGEFRVDARAGRVYFVSLQVLAGHSKFAVVPEDVAQERLRACCALLDNWASTHGPLSVR